MNDWATIKAQATESGSCGEDMRWYALGHDLYIEGTGLLDMYFEAWEDVMHHSSPYGIERVFIAEGCTAISGGAFGRGCESPSRCWGSLVSVELPESLTALEGDTFSCCDALEAIQLPAHLEIIGDNAFECCTSLRSLTLPASVRVVDGSAFDGCERLMEVHVHPDNPHLASVDGVLFTKDMRTLIAFPPGREGSYIIPDGVEDIGTWAFWQSRLTSLHIPGSVRKIASHAFGHWFLAGWTTLTDLTIPDTVTEIAPDAFSRIQHITYHGPARSPNNWEAKSLN